MEFVEYQAQYIKRLHEKRKEEGLCPICGKPAKEGRKLCEACTERNRKRQREKPRIIPAKWPSGYCYICGGESMPGRKLCKQHENYFDNAR